MGIGSADVKHKGMRNTQRKLAENRITLSDPQSKIVETKVEKEETVKRIIRKR
jgi:hypothetical protein